MTKEKRISYDQFQSVKRVAQACNPLMTKREKVAAKIKALAEEYKDYDTQISALEAGIVKVIGFRVEELVKKVITSTPGTEGKEVKTTKYLPTDKVSYDAEKKQFVITYEVAEQETDVPDAPDTPTETPEVQAEVEHSSEEVF